MHLLEIGVLGYAIPHNIPAAKTETIILASNLLILIFNHINDAASYYKDAASYYNDAL